MIGFNNGNFDDMLSWVDAEEGIQGGVRAWQNGSVDPEEMNEAQLGEARVFSRWLSGVNGFAVCGLKNRRNYVVRQGLSHEVVNADDSRPAPGGVMSEGKRWLSGFLELNNLPAIEKECCIRHDRDGEAFLRLFATEEGQIVRFVEPESIVSVNAERHKFGMICEKPDFQNCMGWVVDGQEVSAGEMCWIMNRMSSRMFRGVPMWLPCFQALAEAAGLLRGMSKLARARCKIAILIKVQGLTGANENQMLAALQAKSDTSQGGGQHDDLSVPSESLPDAAVIRINRDDEMSFMSASMGAGEYVSVLQAQLEYCAGTINMPAWMLTSHNEEKYANAFASEAPCRMAFEEVQSLLCQAIGMKRKGCDRSLIRKAMERDVKAKRLSASVLEYCTIKSVAPSLEVRDPNGEANMFSGLIRDGLVSKKTSRMKLGYDDEEEKKMIADEVKEATDAAAAEQAAQQPPVDPNAMQDPMAGGYGQQPQDQSLPPDESFEWDQLR